MTHTCTEKCGKLAQRRKEMLNSLESFSREIIRECKDDPEFSAQAIFIKLMEVPILVIASVISQVSKEKTVDGSILEIIEEMINQALSHDDEEKEPVKS